MENNMSTSNVYLKKYKSFCKTTPEKLIFLKLHFFMSHIFIENLKELNNVFKLKKIIVVFMYVMIVKLRSVI